MQRSHPPIVIGAAGRGMLRLVAQLADGWNWNRWDKREFERWLKILRSYCSDASRNFDSIEKSIETPVLVRSNEHQLRRVVQQAIDLNPQKSDLSIEEFRQNSLTGNADEYVGLGVSRFMFYFPDLPSLDGMNLFADEVMPSFK